MNKVKEVKNDGTLIGYISDNTTFYPLENCIPIEEWIANGNTIEDEFTPEELEAQATIINKQKISLDKQNGKVYTSLDNIDYIVPLTSEDANGLIQVQIGFEKGYISSTNFICSNGVTIPLDSVTNLLHLGEWFVKERNKFFILEV